VLPFSATMFMAMTVLKNGTEGEKVSDFFQYAGMKFHSELAAQFSNFCQ
jgi:hypothetical protein